jgi:hypothetical protein
MHRWRDNGILESRMGQSRAVFIERDVFAGTLERIEEAVGLPLDRIVIEAKSHDAKLYVDDVVSGALGAVVRFPPFRKYAYVFMTVQASYIGLANARVLDYKLGTRLVGRTETVYHPVLFTGDIAGAFESIEGVRCRPRYGWVGDSLFLEASVDESAEEEGRLRLERPPVIPAKVKYDRCGACGIPRLISRFRWEPKLGKIIDSDTGAWVIYIDVEGLLTILRELEDELGEEIPRMVSRFTFDFYRELIAQRKTARSYLSDLSFMVPRGFGVPEKFNPTPGELEEGVRIINGFSGPIIAGLVAAVCGGDDPRFSWEAPEPGVVLVKVKG